MTQHPQESPKHERSSVNPATVSLWGAALAVLIAVSLAITWGVWQWLAASRQSDDALTGTQEMFSDDGGLNPNQRATLLRYEEEQQTLLTEYAWIDEEQGIARIPIDRAMEMVVEQREEAN